MYCVCAVGDISSQAYTVVMASFVYIYDFTKSTVKAVSTTNVYGYTANHQIGTNGSQGKSTSYITYPFDDTRYPGNTNSAIAWYSNNTLTPDSGSSTNYWDTDVTYKWIAVWLS